MIDINCDVGEGLNNEHLLMPYISSCNIACGAHAGSKEILKSTMLLAKKNGVKIGVHPSYPDRVNFGRMVMNIPRNELSICLMKQFQLFKEASESLKVKIHHVKPHGALYSVIAVNREIAQVVIEAVLLAFHKVKLYVPYQSVISELALENKIPIVYEAFADRNYNDDLTLVSRNHKKAVLSKPNEIVYHVKKMSKGKVITINGLEKQIKAETFCVHGDNKNVLEIVKVLNQNFTIV